MSKQISDAKVPEIAPWAQIFTKFLENFRELPKCIEKMLLEFKMAADDVIRSFLPWVHNYSI